MDFAVMSQRSRWIRYLIGGAKWSIVVITVAWLLASGRLDLEQMTAVWRYPWVLVGGLLLVVLNLWITGLRFAWLLHRVDRPIALAEAVRLSFIGHTMNMLAFGSASADLTRAVLVARVIGCGGGATAMVLVDRCTGLFGLVVIALAAVWTGASPLVYDGMLLGLLLGIECCWWGIVVWCWTGLQVAGRLPFWSWWVLALGLTAVQLTCHFLHQAPTHFIVASSAVAGVGIVAGGLCAVLAKRAHRLLAGLTGSSSARWRRLLGAAAEVLMAMHRRPVATVQAIALSVVAQVPLIIALVWIGAVLQPDSALTPWLVCIATPLAILSTTLPIPGGGIGVGEAAFDVTLRHLTVGAVTGGATVFLTLRGLLVLVALAAIPWWLRRGGERHINAHGESGIVTSGT